MKTNLTLGKQFTLFYLVTMAVIVGGSAVSLWNSWTIHTAHIKAELTRESHIANSQLKSVLLDANKLLDVAKMQIVHDMENGRFNDRSVHDVFLKSGQTFSSYISNNAYALMVYVDQNGQVRSTSKDYPTAHKSLSDRLYFRVLREHSEVNVTVGNLVTAKTTGLLTLHLATPLLDKNGKFIGVLTQQILAKNIADILTGMLDGIQTEIVAHIGDGNVAFIYPNPVSQDQADRDKYLLLEKKVRETGLNEGVFLIHADRSFLADDAYVAFMRLPEYELTTTVALPMEKAWSGFVKEQRILIAYIALAMAVATLFYYYIYRISSRLNLAIEESLTDQLTGIGNRRAMDIHLPKLWKTARRTVNPISALFLDIDFFKKFNDTYGHENADIALKAAASTIKSCANRQTDICCRWGGRRVCGAAARYR